MGPEGLERIGRPDVPIVDSAAVVVLLALTASLVIGFSDYLAAQGWGMAVAVEYVNRTLRFEEEVERYLELPVLAVIPDLESTAAIARA